MKKILAFGAHPDDIEFGCGGLLIKEIAQGAQVKIVVCSLGEAGTNGTPAGRKAEALAAAKFIGAEIEFISLGGDSHIESNPKNAFKLAEVMRTYRPDIVLAQSISENQHPDHVAVTAMVRTACRLARYGGLKELKKRPVHAIESLYYYPSSSALDMKVDVIVDISEHYETWVKAMSHHASQMKTRSYLDLVGSRAQAWGASIGVKYAAVLTANDPVRVKSLSDLESSRNY